MSDRTQIVLNGLDSVGPKWASNGAQIEPSGRQMKPSEAQNGPKLSTKGSTGGPTGNQMRPREAQWGLGGASWSRTTPKRAPLEANWRPNGAQVGPKIASKSIPKSVARCTHLLTILGCHFDMILEVKMIKNSSDVWPT